MSRPSGIIPHVASARPAALAAFGPVLFECARLLDEIAQAEVNRQAGRRVLTPALVRLLPHLSRDGIRPTELARRIEVSKQAVGQALADLGVPPPRRTGARPGGRPCPAGEAHRLRRGRVRSRSRCPGVLCGGAGRASRTGARRGPHRGAHGRAGRPAAVGRRRRANSDGRTRGQCGASWLEIRGFTSWQTRAQAELIRAVGLYSDREPHAPSRRLPDPAGRPLGGAGCGGDLRRALHAISSGADDG